MLLLSQSHPSGNKSQYQKPIDKGFLCSLVKVSSLTFPGALYSRNTFFPDLYDLDSLKIGPSKTKVWNSPFSPQGSIPGGKSFRKSRSIIRPAKLSSSNSACTHTTIA